MTTKIVKEPTLLTKLCNYLGINFFVITDWDFQTDFQDKIHLNFDLLKEESCWDDIKEEDPERAEKTLKGMITNNKKIIDNIPSERLHFNMPKLEGVIGYKRKDKNSLKIWEILTTMPDIPNTLFPSSLETFLEFDKLVIDREEEVIQIAEELSTPPTPQSYSSELLPE